MINLWNPIHVSVPVDLLTAFLLGIVHGITPDEHTWPITFAYAVGAYSTWRGMRAGFLFSAAFTLQRALASELAWAGLSRFIERPGFEIIVYFVVGTVMVISAWMIASGKAAPHLHIGHNSGSHDSDLHDPRWWLPLLHGFIAGWGMGAFAAILYGVLAPAMPDAMLGFAPGLAFGLGTMVTQIAIGGLVGAWAARARLAPEQLRQIALASAARTLAWGGAGLVLVGALNLLVPKWAGLHWNTGLHIHNLHTIDLPMIILITVIFVAGVGGFVRDARATARRIARPA
ncbi:MAG: sulfite exporter TauE/SafE family protein [Hyphomicrobiales bacterium]|nr:sulfite exporter TauE/SafE family protein [Hyphomicrobiales bacterium]